MQPPTPAPRPSFTGSACKVAPCSSQSISEFTQTYNSTGAVIWQLFMKSNQSNANGCRAAHPNVGRPPLRADGDVRSQRGRGSSARARRGRRRRSPHTTASYSRWPCSGGSRSRSSGRSRRARASAEKLQSAPRRTLVHGAGLPGGVN